MHPIANRRDFLLGGGLSAAEVLLARDDPSAVLEPQGPGGELSQVGCVGDPNDRGKLAPGRTGRDSAPPPIETPGRLEMRSTWVDSLREFRLTLRPGHIPRRLPTIVVTEGESVRFVLENQSARRALAHWHGLETAQTAFQEAGAGATVELTTRIRQVGTLFYCVESADSFAGMGFGLLAALPRRTTGPGVDRDIAFLFDDPEQGVPGFGERFARSRALAEITVAIGSRVRLRLVNVMPQRIPAIHLEGHPFWLTGTEAGPLPQSSWMPGNTLELGFAQARDIEFIAKNEGTWRLGAPSWARLGPPSALIRVTPD